MMGQLKNVNAIQATDSSQKIDYKKKKKKKNGEIDKFGKLTSENFAVRLAQ